MRYFSLLFCAFLLSACLLHNKLSIRTKGNLRLEQVEFSELKNWENDDHKKALQAFLHSCRKFAKMAPSRLVGGQIGDITAKDFYDVCEIGEVVKTMSQKQAQNFFENWFKVFEVSNSSGNSNGLFTGYYEASINGSKHKSEKFKYPIYAKPKDLKNEPYLSRKEIEEGALKDKGLELIYTDDAIELFFMHIQGSGRVKLDDGSEIRLAYAARNNQPFVAIANYMADAGYLDRSKLSAMAVKEWLKANPDKAQEVMNVNPSYVFFKIFDGEYVVGGQGVPLTPERSLAVDSEIMPYGLPLFVDTILRKKDGSKEDYSHLFIAQDTGSAIKGAVRGDIFFGRGIEAEDKAYNAASKGRYYILMPINVVDKLSR